MLGGEKALHPEAGNLHERVRPLGRRRRCASHKLSPGDVVVIHDELDLPPGKTAHEDRRRPWRPQRPEVDRGAYRQGFPPLRLGIGHPGSKELVNGYVLHDFAKADGAWVTPLIDAIAENAPLLAEGQDATFMNRVHLALAQSDEPDEPERCLPRLPAGGAANVGTALAAGLKKLLGRTP